MSKTIYMIKWDDLTADTYLYGAHIERKENCIIYQQPLMPPGSTIKKWSSITDYQKDRIEPSLPYLKEGHTYHLHAYMRSNPLNSCYLRLNFYNYYGEILDFMMTSSEDAQFNVPRGTHHYELLLMKGHAETIIFERVDLFEEPLIDHFDEHKDQVNILVLEPQGSMLKIPDATLLEELGNVILLPARQYSDNLSYVFNHRKDYKQIRIIGYGTISNAIVKELLKSFKNAKGYVYNESIEMHNKINFGDVHDHFFNEALSNQTKRLEELPFLKHKEIG